MFYHSIATRISGLSLCLSIIISATALGQKSAPILYPDDPFFLKKQFIPKTYHPEHITKKPGHYTITDWEDAIDSTWGWGLPKAQKLQIFDTFWDTIDEDFACFNGIEINWDSLRAVYRTEIEDGDLMYGVSRGRFAGMMHHLSVALRESHTYADDKQVSWYTQPDPGVPLLFAGAWGENGHFGAGLTPLPDSSLLVYRTVPNHPLGLEQGDIVLGYDGIPWKELYFELIEAQLPLYSFWYEGSCESAYTHSWLMSAGMNWHLFDTIDIVKYGTDDTLHLSVEPLIGQDMTLFCSEQMDIPGVPMPDFDVGVSASYGIIEGTQIGYIYAWDWHGDIELQFYEAVSTLASSPDITGLVIDLRLNWGGAHHLANAGLSLLFNTKELGFGYGERCSPSDHLGMCSNDFAYYHYIYGSANAYFDKPIAVLTGPGTHSAGDNFAITMKPHPMTRFFGKSSESAFNYPVYFYFGGYTDWRFRVAIWNEYMLDDPSNYLTHSELEIDEDIWLTPDDVADGHDTVVDAAVAWINSQQSAESDIAYDPAGFDVSLGYGETATQDLTIYNNGTRNLFYSLTPQIETGLRIIGDNRTPDVYYYPKSHESDFLNSEASRAKSPNDPPPPPEVLGHGGFDDFGHVWVDSDQPHGPSFNWVDISGIGTRVALGDDSYVGPIDIGFEFPFFENSYSELYICSNGLLTFEYGSNHYLNFNIPNTYTPSNFIAPWWDDLDPSAGGDVYYYSQPESQYFIVSFVGIPKFDYESSTTFQAILYPSGQVEFNYVKMELEFAGFWDFYTATIGIENSDGTDGLELYYMAPYTIDNYSILITTDWLAASPYSSYIAPGENEVATVTFSAKHLLPGDYTGNIYLESNDPDEPSIAIPVSLEVLGCAYTPGDCNHNGTALELADVIAMIGLYRGSVDPYYTCDCPPRGSEFAPEADPNGNCIPFELGDVVTEISAYRGSTEASGCEDCPGSLRLHTGGGVHPLVTPSLKTKAKKTAPASQ